MRRPPKLKLFLFNVLMPRWYVPNGHDAVDSSVHCFRQCVQITVKTIWVIFPQRLQAATYRWISGPIWKFQALKPGLHCSADKSMSIPNTTLCRRIISELTEVFFSKPDIVTTYYCIKSFYWSQFWVASTSPSAFSTYIRRGRERIEQICRCVTHIRLMWISRGVPKNFSRIAHGFCWSTWSIQYRAEVGVLDSSQASSQVYKIPS